ncbi:hypothetical protein AB833_24400 [Chromatiales bacterium (ex Bugula neritina AB1)]|nr:hypothetical protein AB833_24400 [Chromatiales bacterium (ex Bugula neritina AB1)]
MNTARTFNNAYFLLVLAPLLWGGNAVAGKIASFDWQPFTITNVRWVLTALILLPIAWPHIKKDWPVIRRSWKTLFLLGGIGMAMFNLLMYTALHYTSAINVSIEQASMPAMIMLANFVIMSQRVTWLQIVGLLLSIVGVLITTTEGNPALFFQQGLNRGDAIMMLACAFYAAYTFGLRWRPPVHWLSFMGVISVFAIFTTLPFAIWEWQTGDVTVPGPRGWVVLSYIIIFPTIVSQIAYARGVELIGSNRAGPFINLVPIFGSLLAVIILGEHFQSFHAAGLLLVVGGIMLAEKSVKKIE